MGEGLDKVAEFRTSAQSYKISQDFLVPRNLSQAMAFQAIGKLRKPGQKAKLEGSCLTFYKFSATESKRD